MVRRRRSSPVPSISRTAQQPAVAVLPPLIVLPGEMSKNVHWLEPTLKFIACEAASVGRARRRS